MTVWLQMTARAGSVTAASTVQCHITLAQVQGREARELVYEYEHKSERMSAYVVVMLAPGFLLELVGRRELMPRQALCLRSPSLELMATRQDLENGYGLAELPGMT